MCAGWMLRENPQQRPNIYQVVSEVCSMRHRAVPIKDVREQSIPKLYSLICIRYTRSARSQRLEETSNYHLGRRMLPLLP